MKKIGSTGIRGKVRKMFIKIQHGRMTKRQILLVLLIMSSLACLSACQTGPSKPSSKDPYADNAPKTKEEEAYYQDVYSGEWREQNNPFGMGKSICKKNGGTSMPQHWAMMPHGAKTMSEIRSEMDNQRTAQINQQLAAQSAPQVAMNGNMPQNSDLARYNAQAAAYNAAAMNGNTGRQAAQVPYSAPVPYSVPNSSAPVSYSTVNHAAWNNQNQNYPAINNQGNGDPMQNTPIQMSNGSMANGQVQNASMSNGRPAAVGSAPVVNTSQNNMTNGNMTNGNMTNGNMTNGNMTNGAVSNGMSGGYNGQNQSQGNSAAGSAPFPQVPGFSSGMNNSNTMPNSNSNGAAVIRNTDDVVVSNDLQETVIIRGQMPEPIEKVNTETPIALRKRMRSAYFTDEPVKVAQAGGTASADTVLNEDQNGQVPAAQSSVIKNGEQQTLKVNPNIAAPWKTLPPNAPLPHKTGVNRRQQELRSYEYIFDGGDRKGEYYSTPDWHNYNLDVEDSITQFDTEDGQIMAEPSNRVQIYSPRFGSVRQVLGPAQKTEVGAIANTETDTPSLTAQTIAGTEVRSQEVRAGFTRTDRMASSASAKTRGDSISNEIAPAEQNQYDWVGHMDSIMVSDSIQDADRPTLMTGTTAAEAWGSIQQVAVDIDSVRAQVNIYNKSAEALVTVVNGTKTSKLRMFKVANKQSAQPGELVEFTLRYENVGNTTVGNVTVMDNLAARLEYVDGSSQSSRKGDFFVKSNSAGSQVLRWEITDPLKKGEFGVVKFICKVR